MFSLTALGVYVYFLLSDAGVFRPLNTITFGQCLKIHNVQGPEDMARLPNSNEVVISSSARSENEETPVAKGNIYLYNIETKDLRSLFKDTGFPFEPHGLDVIQVGNEYYIYVINHRDRHRTTIEVFLLGPQRDLVHLKTLSDPLFQSGNDILVSAVDEFFLTSDFSTTNTALQKLQQFTWNPSGYISFFDRTKAAKVIQPIFYANGITFSDDKKFVFVSAMLEKAIHVYEVSGSHLKFLKLIPLEGAPDNLTWSNSRLYAAVHPNLFSLKQVSEDRSKKAPSKLLEIKNWNGPDIQITTIYENDGKEISSASVVLPLSADRILIGSVFDNHFLDCSKSPSL